MRLVAAAAAALAVAAPAAAQDIAISLAPGEVLLKVEARGIHMGRPDTVDIGAAVVTTGSTAKAALEANAALANRLLAAVRANGIAPADVQTSQLTVRPEFDPVDADRADREDRKPRIIGYIARNRVNLTLRDLSRAAEIIHALFEAGANEVSGPHFSHSDPEPAIRAARRDAVAEARKEAETYADALGMRIVRVLRVSERGSFESEEGNYITVTGSRIPVSPLEPGEISTRVEVWIDYAMAPR